MSSVVAKLIDLLERLSLHPEGLSVSDLAKQTGQPVSGTHRTLAELVRLGYVQQLPGDKNYALTVRLPSLGLSYFSRTGVSDIVQPVLDRLAGEFSELARLCVTDGERLVWVAVAQGVTSGLRFDPAREQGQEVHLACTANGHAWLMAMSDEEALTAVGRQGLVPNYTAGKNAPQTIRQLLDVLAVHRKRGYAATSDTFLDGMAAIAVPVMHTSGQRVLGCLSIAGPTVRMSDERMASMAPQLVAAAQQIGNAASASRFLTGSQSADASTSI